MGEFLGKVKESLGKSVTVVSTKSKEVMGGVKIRNRLGDLERRKKETYEQLGAMVYSLYQKDATEFERVICEKCQEIAGLDAEINSEEEELKQLQIESRKSMGIPSCSCGEALAEEDAFCRKCGAKVKKEVSGKSN